MVEILDIRPGPQGVATIIPGYGQLIDVVESPVTKVLPVRDGIIHFSDEILFPVRSMVGVVGVATGGEEIVNAMPGQHGGNLDDHLHGIGTKIYFPVRQPGGRLLAGEWGMSMEDAFILLSIRGDVGVAQACKPSPFASIARVVLPKLQAIPAPFRT